MKQIGGRTFGAMGVALIAGGLGTTPLMAAKIKASIETTVRLGYDINPFLQQGSDLGSGVVRAEVQPMLSYRTETTQAQLTGNYERSEYQRLYSHADEYGATLDVRKRVSPALNVFATLRYDSSIIGQGDSLANNAVGTPPVDNTDVNLIGQRQRSNLYSAQAGGSYKLSPRDEFSLDGGATLTRFPGRPAGSASNDYNGRLAYTHAISPRTKIGFSETVTKIVYDVAGLNTFVVEPSVTFSTKLSSTWTFDATAGVSISTVAQPGVSGRHKSTSWAGSADLCHVGSRNDFCFYASRTVSSSGIGSSTVRSQAAFQFNQRITERLSGHANASFAQTTSQIAALGKREYLSAGVGLSQKLTRRLSIGIDGRYRDVFDGPAVKADLGGEVSATLALPGPS
jgi:hypothetical protein